jgi:hypothetical protein
MRYHLGPFGTTAQRFKDPGASSATQKNQAEQQEALEFTAHKKSEVRKYMDEALLLIKEQQDNKALSSFKSTTHRFSSVNRSYQQQ